MIKKIFQILALSLVLLTIFLVLTFPYGRLTPKVKQLLEQSLSQGLSLQSTCSLEGLDYAFPLGVQFQKLVCTDDIQNQKVLDLSEAQILVLPGFQKLSAQIGRGEMTLSFNSGLGSPPSRIKADFNAVPIDKVMPLLGAALNRINYLIPKNLKAEGQLQGSLDWPLKLGPTQSGQIDLTFKNLKFPQQSQLDNLGFKDLQFSKSNLKVLLSRGKLSFSDVSFLAQALSAKVEGQMELAEDLKKSMGALSIKWKVEKSDAMMASILGRVLATTCPSPDSEGFCTKRISRFSELGM